MAVNQADNSERVLSGQHGDSMTLKELIHSISQRWLLIATVWGSVIALVLTWTFICL